MRAGVENIPVTSSSHVVTCPNCGTEEVEVHLDGICALKVENHGAGPVAVWDEDTLQAEGTPRYVCLNLDCGAGFDSIEALTIREVP